MVRRLLARPGIEMDGRDATGFSPLMSAVRIGHVEVVKVLVEEEVDLHATDEDGKTLKDLAWSFGRNQEILDILESARKAAAGRQAEATEAQQEEWRQLARDMKHLLEGSSESGDFTLVQP